MKSLMIILSLSLISSLSSATEISQAELGRLQSVAKLCESKLMAPEYGEIDGAERAPEWSGNFTTIKNCFGTIRESLMRIFAGVQKNPVVSEEIYRERVEVNEENIKECIQKAATITNQVENSSIYEGDNWINREEVVRFFKKVSREFYNSLALNTEYLRIRE